LDRYILLLVLLSGSGLAFAAATSSDPTTGGVLFYAGFEGRLDAAARGAGRGTWQDGQAQFAAGKRGQAVLSGDGAGYASYSSADNISGSRGSIELWFCPQDWQGNDDKYHVFFEDRGQGWLVLYKFYKPDKKGLTGLFLASDDMTHLSLAKQSFSAIKPHEWHQLVATWSPDRMVFFLDGQASPELQHPNVPNKLGSQFMIGDRPWSIARNASSLLDEVYIYDRPLTPEEVNWTYTHVTDRPRGKDLPAQLRQSVAARLKVESAINKLQVSVAVSGQANFAATARLVPESAGAAGIVVNAAGAGGIATASLPLSGLPAGEYKVLITALDAAGRQLGTTSLPFSWPGTPVWRGNGIGIQSVPPSPWSPLQVTGWQAGAAGGSMPATINCWGRIYQLNQLGMPSQIESLQGPLLATPVELRATSAGQQVEWNPTSWQLLANDGLRATFKGSANSGLGTLQWKCTAEFDRMLRYDLVLQPAPQASVESMEMHIPVADKTATLQYTLEPQGTFNKAHTGATSPQPGVGFESPWTICWWLGNETRGLSGWCETDEAWDKINRRDGFRIERGSGSVEAVWAFVAGPHVLSKPWKFTFGLQATPVKPLPARWRSWRLSPFSIASYRSFQDTWKLDPRNKNVQIAWATPDLIKYYGYPSATDPAGLTSYVKNLHDKGISVIPYTLITALSAASPEGKLYGETWSDSMIARASSFSDVNAYHSDLIGMSPTSEWADFIVWRAKQFVDRYGFDGLYHDLTHVVSSSNLAAGFGYRRDGKVRPSYPIFGMREVYKRIYTMLKQHGASTGRETFMLSHMSTNMVIPILSFSDGYLDGENFQAAGLKDNYLDFVSLEGLRTEFIGRNFGIIPFVLPELHHSAKTPDSTRHLAGLSLLNDFLLWPIWVNIPAIQSVYAVTDAFGLADAQVAPYWNNHSLVGGQTSSIKCTVYTRNSQALLCVVNTTRQTQHAQLSINWSQLKPGGAPVVTDALDHQPFQIAGNKLNLDVAPLGLRLLWLK